MQLPLQRWLMSVGSILPIMAVQSDPAAEFSLEKAKQITWGMFAGDKIMSMSIAPVLGKS